VINLKQFPMVASQPVAERVDMMLVIQLSTNVTKATAYPVKQMVKGFAKMTAPGPDQTQHVKLKTVAAPQQLATES
jgi:hypothetical protein